jgi:hypothetical protein
VDYAASTIVSFARARQRPSCVDKLLDKGQVGTRFYWIFIWGELCTLSLPVQSGSEGAAKVAPVWDFVELYELILCFVALSFVLDFCFILLSKLASAVKMALWLVIRRTIFLRSFHKLARFALICGYMDRGD